MPAIYALYVINKSGGLIYNKASYNLHLVIFDDGASNAIM